MENTEAVRYVYNYWRNIGSFYYEGFTCDYNHNGYDIPVAIIYDETFRKFFNLIFDSEFRGNLGDKNFTKESCLKIIKGNSKVAVHFNLFESIDFEDLLECRKRKHIKNNLINKPKEDC